MAEIENTPYRNSGNLIAYYKLDDRFDEIAGRHLTETNETYLAGKYGNACRLGVSSHLVYTGDSASYNGGAYSVSLWVKPHGQISAGIWPIFRISDSGTDTVLSLDYEYNSGSRRLRYFRDRVGVGSASVYNTVTLSTNRYHHLFFSYNGSTIAGFLNGNLVGTTTQSGNGTSSAGEFVRINLNTSTVSGSFYYDDIALFNRYFQQYEVRNIYNDVGGGSFLIL